MCFSALSWDCLALSFVKEKCSLFSKCVVLSFVKEKCSLFSKCVVEFTCYAIWFWTFVLAELFVTDSISLLIVGLFLFSLSSWFSMGRLYISSRFALCCCIAVHSYLSWSFMFLFYHLYNFSFFVCDFIDLGPLPFLLDGSDWRLIDFVYLFKKLDLCLIFPIFLLFISFISCVLYDLFPSNNFEFCLFSFF